MHTFAPDDQYRIHHHGVFEGDVCVYDKSMDVGVRIDTEEIIRLAKTYDPDNPDELVVLAGENFDTPGHRVQVEIPLRHLAAVVADRYVRRSLKEWLENLDDRDLLVMIDGVEAWRKKTVLNPIIMR